MARSGPLNWPQERQWLNMSCRRLDGVFPVFRNGWEVTEVVTVAEARAALRRTVRDHEVLRTIFTLEPDGMPIQRVLDDFDPEILVYDMAVYEKQIATPAATFVDGAPVGVPLWRAELYTLDGLVRRVVIAAEHIVFDFRGMRSWEAQFHRLVRGEPHLLGRIRHPLDHKDNSSGTGQVAANRVVEERRPQIMVPAVEPVEGPRYLTSEAEFNGLLGAVDEIARRHSCSRSTVMTFVLGLLLSHHARQEIVHLRTLVCPKSGNDESIDCRMFPIDVELAFDGRRSVRDQLGAVHDAVMLAYEEFSARSPLDALEATISYAIARGAVARTAPQFDFLGESWPSSAAGNVTCPAEADVSPIKDIWAENGEPYAQLFGVSVERNRVGVIFIVDTKMLSQKTVHQMFMCFPQLVRELSISPFAAICDLSALGMVVPFSNHGMSKLGADWISLQALRDLLESLPGVTSAAVEIVDDGVLARLEAVGMVDVRTLHEQVLASLWDRSDIVAPRRYEIRFSGQANRTQFFDPADALVPISAQGQAELAVAAAFEAANGKPPSDLGLSYLPAGGRLIRAPVFIDSILSQGYVGLMLEHLISPFSLRSVAASLRPAAEADGATGPPGTSPGGHA